VSKSGKLSSSAQERLVAFQAKQKLETEKNRRRTTDNRTSLLVAAGAVVLAIGAQFSFFSFGPGNTDSTDQTQTEQPAPEANSAEVPSPELAESRLWTGNMQVGPADLDIELYGELAPQAVANFISLVRAGFYEGVGCHRMVTEGIFILQCGDPTGTGSGDPGYKFGPIENAPADDIYESGVIAMARQSNNGLSMGSQFFIVFQESRIPSDVAGGYTVLGKITAGLEALAPVIEAGVDGGGTEGSPNFETLLGTIELR
jgi:peptidyl-prolyl cis-trans isomerase B (cyclophilin B)